MALDAFIPEIWSARLLDRLNKSLVFGQAGVANRQYEGEISQAGDTVHIGGIGDVTVADYDESVGLGDPERLNAVDNVLVIDQQKSFNFRVEDVERVQAKPAAMNSATDMAATQLAEVADNFLAGLLNTAANASTTVTGVADATNIYGKLVQASIELDKKSVPKAGRFAVVSPDIYGLLLQDDRFVQVFGEQVVGNAQVGKAAGFTVYESNATALGSAAVAGHPMGWAYAESLSQIEAYRPDKFFADAVRGLHVYGAKVVRPDAFARITNAA